MKDLKYTTFKSLLTEWIELKELLLLVTKNCTFFFSKNISLDSLSHLYFLDFFAVPYLHKL